MMDQAGCRCTAAGSDRWLGEWHVITLTWASEVIEGKDEGTQVQLPITTEVRNKISGCHCCDGRMPEAKMRPNRLGVT